MPNTRAFQSKCVVKDLVIENGTSVTFEDVAALAVNTDRMSQIQVFVVQTYAATAGTTGLAITLRHAMNAPYPAPSEDYLISDHIYTISPALSAPAISTGTPQTKISDFPLLPYPFDETDTQRPQFVLFDLTNTDATNDVTVSIYLNLCP